MRYLGVPLLEVSIHYLGVTLSVVSALSTLPGRHSFGSIGRVEIGRCIEESLHSAIAIERRHVEEHLSRFEREEERAGVGQLVDPTGQVTRHDEERILQLTIRFGG